MSTRRGLFDVRCGTCRRRLGRGDVSSHAEAMGLVQSFDISVTEHRPGVDLDVHHEPMCRSWSFDCRCGRSHRVGPDRLGVLVSAAIAGDGTVWLD